MGENSFMWGSLPAGLRMVDGSTRVPILTWNRLQRSGKDGTRDHHPPVIISTSQNNCNTVIVKATKQTKLYKLVEVLDRKNRFGFI